VPFSAIIVVEASKLKLPECICSETGFGTMTTFVWANSVIEKNKKPSRNNFFMGIFFGIKSD
jgi:hypothetical protein